MPTPDLNPNVQWTLEIVPAHAERVTVFEGLVDEIFVTMIPGSNSDATINALARVREAGFEAVPHLAARNFQDQLALEYFCDGMRDNGIRKALVIAGGLSQPSGSFTDSLQLLRSAAFQRSGVDTVALAGHPEGNPGDPAPRHSFNTKCHLLREQGKRVEVVTQWSFAPDRVSKYVSELREVGFEGPVRVGVAGPASLKTLLKYAKICGVAAATEVLKKQGFSLGRLLVANDPAQFVTKVDGTRTFHLYPFGGLEKCVDWLRSRTLPDGTAARTGKHSPLKT